MKYSASPCLKNAFIRRLRKRYRSTISWGIQFVPACSRYGSATNSRSSRKPRTGLMSTPIGAEKLAGLRGNRRPRELGSTRARRLDRLGQRLQVVRAVVAPAVDEERWRARDAARVGAGDVLGDSRCVNAAAQLIPKSLDVEAD